MKIEAILWNNKDNHDKIWGAIFLDRKFPRVDFLIFWGRRGSKLRTNIVKKNYTYIDDMVEEKINDGYSEFFANDLDTIHPDLKKQLEKIYFLSMLKK